MANFLIQGRLLKKLKIENERTQLREFVVEIIGEKFEAQYLNFQLAIKDSPIIDIIEEGETIKVLFELRGKEKEGRYSTYLQALKIEKILSFKYQSAFDKHDLVNCPPEQYKVHKMTCFRYVFEDPTHKNNFLPASLIKPARLNSKKDSKGKCELLGLSLFEDVIKAKKKYQETVANYPNFPSLVGNYFAQVELDLNDGKGSEPNADSHFTFHEYADADLVKKIIKVEKI